MAPPSPTETTLNADLRRHDRDRYLVSLLAPQRHWPALTAILGFNLEIARIRETVSQPIIGQIRLQWWRDALDEIYQGRAIRRHEVVQPLAAAITKYGLSRSHFEALLDAREQDLGDTPPADLAALEAYAEGSSAGLLYLWVEILRRDPRESGFAAARAVGIAWALTGLIRAIPFHASAQRIYLPVDLALAAGLHEQDIYAAEFDSRLGQVVASLVLAARRHLVAGRALRAETSSAILPALLLARLADAYLTRIERAGYNPYAPEVQAPDPQAGLRLTWGWLSNRY